MKLNKGFSLIELMVVIAIVAVLAVIAVPYYKSYTIRALVTANIDAAFGVHRLWVEKFYYVNNRWPDPVSLSCTGNCWSSWDGGQIFVRYSGAKYPEIEGRQFGIYPVLDPSGGIYWTCATTGGYAPEFALRCSHLPANCQEGCI